MHRSGTSLIAGVLRILGVNLGENLMGSAPSNELGHFEHSEINLINDAVLKQLNSSWDDANELPDFWHKREDILPYKQQIKDIIGRDFAKSPLFCIKDPRISILLPIYLNIFAELDIEPLFIIMKRDAAEISKSLYQRNDFSLIKSLDIIIKYEKSIERFTDNAKKVYISFNDLVNYPRYCIEKIKDNLGIPLKSYENLEKDLVKFIDPRLKHHNLLADQLLKDLLSSLNSSYKNLKEQGDLLAEKEDSVNKLSAFSNSQDQQLKNLAENLEAREEENAILSENLKAKEGEAVILLEDLKAKEGDLKAKQEDINNFIVVIEELKAAKEKEIKDIIYEKNILINQEEGLIKSLEDEKKLLKDQISEADSHIDAIQRSFTFKCLKKYQRFIEIFLPRGTSTRKFYDNLIFKNQEFWNKKSKKKLYSSGQILNKKAVLSADNGGKKNNDDDIVKAIAFYMPQFHQIKENDEWWGQGFTEWINVRPATPKFEGHYQPRIPAELGYYDLNDPKVAEKQAKLAKEYGIYGFCYYYYRFNGKRLLEMPLNRLIKTGKPDFPFCICWANEDWSRKWDGYNNELLIKQEYSWEDSLKMINELVPVFLDKRYIRINGKPLFVIYRADNFPEITKTMDIWREVCRRNGVGEIHIAMVQSFNNEDPRIYGLDSAIEFPPHRLMSSGPINEKIANKDDLFKGNIYDYEEVMRLYLQKHIPDYKLFRGLIPLWDNTARRKNNSYIFVNSSPEKYKFWLQKLAEQTKINSKPGEKIIFINAWNEWGEGCYLEPDQKFGRKFLEATRDVLHNSNYKEEVEEGEDTKNIIFEKPDNPKVSIIIPVFNKIKYTLKCLKSINENTDKKTGLEIIVVDDNSVDDTSKILNHISNIKIVKNDNNLGFLRSCNNALRYCDGEYVCFLNNDTEVKKGWLEEMLKVMENDKMVGAVGSKLIFPNGLLQEAGGIVFRNGGAANYGRNDNPNFPEYNFLREVDYCSAASILVKKEILQKTKGFDERYSPAYYEDTDLCFAIRNEFGLKVMYQPKSEVIHHEGVSCGTDINSGAKYFQEQNKIKFSKKWEKELKNHFTGDSVKIDAAAKRLCGKKNIILIDNYIPAFDKDSGSNRITEIIKILDSMGYHIIFIPDNPYKNKPYIDFFTEMGVEVLYDNHFKTVIEQVENIFKNTDLVWISKLEPAEKYVEKIKALSPKIKIIYDTVDLHYMRIKRETELSGRYSGGLFNYPDWKQIMAVELRTAKIADAVVVVTEKEKDELAGEGIKNIFVVPNVHNYKQCPDVDFKKRDGLLFIGCYNHTPNIDAVGWLCKEVMPLVWKKRPDIKLTLLGSEPSEYIKSFSSDKISVPGYISDVSSFFKNSRVFVAPLRYGAGMKGKIGQSLEFGLPVISTSIGVEGMDLKNRDNVLIADSDKDFADAIVELYTDEYLWNKLKSNSEEAIRPYLPENVKKEIASLLNNFDDRHQSSLFKKYSKESNKIDGWFVHQFIDVLSAVNEFQIKNNITGDLAEIGVYCGKSFIPLYLLCKENEIALAIDCFEMQKFNYDNSGRGDYSKFIENLKKIAGEDIRKLKVIKGDSMALSHEDYLGESINKKFRIFSIDGCHTVEATLKDLENVSKCISERGVIIVDDYYNSNWPGVAEGVNLFMEKFGDKIVPFFSGYNKLLFTFNGCEKEYKKEIRKKINNIKSCNLYGAEILTI